MTTKLWGSSPFRLFLQNVRRKSAQVSTPPIIVSRSVSSWNVPLVTKKKWRDVGGSTSYCLCHLNNNYEQQLRNFRTSQMTLKNPVEAEDEVVGKGEKVLRVKLASTRVDAVLKTGLQMSRNKVEKAFYDDRVRVNGERPKKKSLEVYEGDEVDVVRNYNSLNPDSFIDVSRLEIMEIGDDNSRKGAQDDDDASDDDDEAKSKIKAVLRRSKLLTIRNYKQPWKGSSSD